MVNIGRRITTLLIVAVAVAACGDDPLAPFEPEVVNITDSFELQATGAENLTRTIIYSWRNTGTVANVNHSTTTSAGSARLIVRAANGAQIYDKQLVPSLNEPTATGTAGDWTIQLVLSNYSGTLNFRLEKP